MLRALIDNDIPSFEEILSDFVLSTLSYFDTQKQDVEHVYQAFMLGMLLNLSSSYEIHSNKESGFGRYDISIIPKDTHKRAIIMELKKIGLSEEFRNEGEIVANSGIEDPYKAYKQLFQPRKLELQREYALNHSLWLDMKILGKTLLAVIGK